MCNPARPSRMIAEGKHCRGFTLVELLVVIGIIALLISILLPALNRARQSAEEVACASNLRQIMIGALGYASENKNWLPQGWDWINQSNNHVYWTRTLISQRYLSEAVMVCPSMKSFPQRIGGAAPGDTYFDSHLPLSYIFNGHVFGFALNVPMSQVYPFRKVSQFSQSSQVVCFFDGFRINDTGVPTVRNDDLYHPGWSAVDDFLTRMPDISSRPHVNEKSNTAFLDGHVEAVFPNMYFSISPF